MKENRKVLLISPSKILAAGFEGIVDNLVAPEEAVGDMISTRASESLPSSLSEAVELARRSDFVAKVISEKILKEYLDDRATEVNEYEKSGKGHDYLISRYFRFI